MGGYSQALAQSERYPPRLCRSDRGCGRTGTLLPRPQGSGIDPVTPRLPHQRRVTAEDPDSVDGATFAIAITSANPALRSDPSRRRSSFCEGPVPGAGAMEGFDSIPTHSGPHFAVTSLPVVLLSPERQISHFVSLGTFARKHMSWCMETQAGLGMESCDG